LIDIDTAYLADAVGHVSYGSLGHGERDARRESAVESSQSVLPRHLARALQPAVAQVRKRLHLHLERVERVDQQMAQICTPPNTPFLGSHESTHQTASQSARRFVHGSRS